MSETETVTAPKTFNAERFAIFSTALHKGFAQDCENNPKDYYGLYPDTDVAAFAARIADEALAVMAHAPEEIVIGSYRGVKLACEIIGIKYTRSSLLTYLYGERIKPLNVSRFEDLFMAYRDALTEDATTNPKMHTLRPRETPAEYGTRIAVLVWIRMAADGPAEMDYTDSREFEHACKKLNIKYTREAILAFCYGEYSKL